MSNNTGEKILEEGGEQCGGRDGPQAYLNYLLTVLPERFANNPRGNIDDLMPWAEDMQKSFGMENSVAEH